MQTEEEDEEEQDENPDSRKRHLGSRSRRDASHEEAEPAVQRSLQTDSSPFSSSGSEGTKFTRYRARVYPANATQEEATGLQATAGSAESSEELQDWLREGGGSWSGAWVTSVEGEVVEELSVVSATSGESQNDKKTEHSDLSSY